MAAFALQRWSLARLLRRHSLERAFKKRERRRLARVVRRHARAERDDYHRGDVIEFDSIAIRTALYELIARVLEDLDRPLAKDGLSELESLLAEPPPFRDYGPNAQARNDRIAAILDKLKTESP
jgi:hypothetical protein